MMKPVYFPFTYVSDPMAEAVSACFGQFVVYCPAREILPEQMQLWINREVMAVRTPSSGNDEALKTAVKSYQNWADLHRGESFEKSTYLKTRMSSMPHLSEFSSSEIIADIKGKKNTKPAAEISDFLLPARIFLYFAQEFDRQNHELTDGLNHHEQQEADLMRWLKMEADPFAEKLQNTTVRHSETLSEYMISDRLEAWARVFCREPEDSGLFLTHSPAVMEYLLDRISGATRILHLESIPSGSEQDSVKKAWQDKLAANLAQLAGTEQTEADDDWIKQLTLTGSDNALSLSIYRVPDQTPLEVFASFVSLNNLVAGRAGHNSKYASTLIALIQI
jgi:hypothetical protein